jgi:hypothetical protein
MKKYFKRQKVFRLIAKIKNKKTINRRETYFLFSKIKIDRKKNMIKI